MVLNGACLCGAVRYETTGTPYAEASCHCSICRRASGASPVAWFSVPRSSFRFTSGTPATFRSSSHAVRKFCAQCGSQLTFESQNTPDEVDITTCTLADPSLVPPKFHIHTASAVAWAALTDQLPKYEKGKLE
jgi:hypothetical protein